MLAAIPDLSLLFRLLEPPESFYRLARAGLDVDRAALYVADSVQAHLD